MLPSEFWDLTHYDIYVYLRAKNKAYKDELKVLTGMHYSIASVIVSGFGGKTISYREAFPQLAENETQTWQKSKQSMLMVSEKYNIQQKRKREINSYDT